jgi:hypothetical protein
MTFRRVLFFYQLLTGLSDTSTGILLIAAPALTLHLMGLSARGGSLLYLSFVGVFVLSVGVACLYGAWLVRLPAFAVRLGEVWILTAIARGLVAASALEDVARRMGAGMVERRCIGWVVRTDSDRGTAKKVA